VISIVVAHGRNRVIGLAGRLPWHIPSDLQRFKGLTTGAAVLMGRRTFESLPATVRPLPGRRNLVVSSDPAYDAAGAEVFSSLDAALEACGHECFVIGGGTVYEQALPLAHRIHLTEIHDTPAGDTYFPRLSFDEWRCVEHSDALSENGHSFHFARYERR
jgi:dihydrofolate reductase